MQITGTLKNARLIIEGDPRCPCLVGDVYGDSKGRFQDGERVTTSRLVRHDDGSIFKTLYSVYRVESWA